MWRLDEGKYWTQNALSILALETLTRKTNTTLKQKKILNTWNVLWGHAAFAEISFINLYLNNVNSHKSKFDSFSHLDWHMSWNILSIAFKSTNQKNFLCFRTFLLTLKIYWRILNTAEMSQYWYHTAHQLIFEWFSKFAVWYQANVYSRANKDISVWLKKEIDSQVCGNSSLCFFCMVFHACADFKTTTLAHCRLSLFNY